MDRFSLLLLEPGEIYFEDFKVVHHRQPEARAPLIHDQVSGRLKVCSKSVVFVPSDHVLPLLKFPLADCDKIEEWSPRSFQSALASKHELLFLSCCQTVEMLHQNIVAPFNFRRSKEKYVFSFTYRKVGDCLSQVQQLHRASSLPPLEQNGMIATIVFSRQARLKFETCWLENLQEEIVVELVANKVSPLVVNPGRVLLTSQRLYYQSYNNVELEPVVKIRLSSLKHVWRRRYLLRPQGLELQYTNARGDQQHLYLSFSKPADRDTLYQEMMKQPDVDLLNTEDNLTMQWQNGVISNFDYLLHLNNMADRSFNDLTQYPVFPWVVSDYTSANLDLDNAQSFRDLTKPIGAINPERLRTLKERSEDLGSARYLYGSHYSTPGFVLYYLVRRVPAYMLCLQNGRFDHPDRMFNSVPQTWRNVTTNQSDFKELVPEFYMPAEGGDFLVNGLDIDFGRRQDGKHVGDVELPPWAENCQDFVNKLRAALESDYVSKNLHHWINLIFGYKQRGTEAVNSDNVFYPLCYEGSVDLDTIPDLNDRYALEVQISEFGQIPKQLFTSPHPRRYTSIPPATSLSSSSLSQDATGRSPRRRPRQLPASFSRLTDYVGHKEPVSSVCLAEGGRLVATAGRDSQLRLHHVAPPAAAASCEDRTIHVGGSVVISAVVSPGCGDSLLLATWDNSLVWYSCSRASLAAPLPAHKDAISCLGWSQGTLASGSWDGSVKLWRCVEENDYKVGFSDLQADLDQSGQVTSLSVKDDQMVTGTRDGHVLLWCLKSRSLAHQLPGHSRQVNSVSLSPTGQQVISAGSDFYVKVFDISTGTVVFSRNLGEEILCMAWDGRQAVVGGAKGDLCVWNLLSAKVVSRHTAHSGAVRCLTASQDFSLLATGGEDNRVIIWRGS